MVEVLSLRRNDFRKQAPLHSVSGIPAGASTFLKRFVRFSVCTLAGLLILACEPPPKLPYYTSTDFTPVWDRTEGRKHRVAPFSYIDQDGKSVTEKTFSGRVYVANFFFTACPGICPRTSKNLATVQAAFREDARVQFLSHSVTPESDSVPVLKRYAEKYGAVSGKWHMVTGGKKAIYTAARESYFADEAGAVTGSPEDFLHTEKMFLVDGEGCLRGVYNGVLPAEMKRLEEDVRTLLEE
jgi:protein SCO1/2